MFAYIYHKSLVLSKYWIGWLWLLIHYVLYVYKQVSYIWCVGSIVCSSYNIYAFGGRGWGLIHKHGYYEYFFVSVCYCKIWDCVDPHRWDTLGHNAEQWIKNMCACRLWKMWEYSWGDARLFLAGLSEINANIHPELCICKYGLYQIL